MKLISREELKEKLDRGDAFKLIMTLGEWAFRAKHIPGSISFPTPEAALEVLDPHEEIVIYCAGEPCIASRAAYKLLVRKHGFTNVRRYAGGLVDWEEAGLPLEGDAVDL